MALLQKRIKVAGKVLLLDVSQIKTNPAQPRTDFEAESLSILASSIAENGLLQPITVRQLGPQQFELISGERRLRACKMLGVEFIPSIVVDKTDRESAILSMIENIHRKDLNMFEQARALKNLLFEWNVTQEEASLKLGMAQSTLANKLRLLKLNAGEQEKVLALGLTERHARALLRLDTPQKRSFILEKIEFADLNVQQTEQLIEGLMSPKSKQTFVPVIKDIRIFVNTINKAVSLMQSAGVPAVCNKNEGDDFIEYTIQIPKSK